MQQNLQFLKRSQHEVSKTSCCPWQRSLCLMFHLRTLILFSNVGKANRLVKYHQFIEQKKLVLSPCIPGQWRDHWWLQPQPYHLQQQHESPNDQYVQIWNAGQTKESVQIWKGARTTRLLWDSKDEIFCWIQTEDPCNVCIVQLKYQVPGPSF